MFGFSFVKLFVLAALILAVLYGFKWVARIQQQHFSPNAKRVRGDKERVGAEDKEHDVEDMIRCAVCGSYSPAANFSNCGKENCPYP